jgi:hypothetical protein
MCARFPLMAIATFKNSVSNHMRQYSNLIRNIITLIASLTWEGRYRQSNWSPLGFETSSGNGEAFEDSWKHNHFTERIKALANQATGSLN